MIKRKPKFTNNNSDPGYSFVDINEDYLEDDPQRKEILRVWNEADDNEGDLEKEKYELRKPSKTITTGTFYLLIIVTIGIFIYLVNVYNVKQLERIKEEYGLDSKPAVPELWWQKVLMYNIIVRSYKDSNGDGIGDINGIRLQANHLLYLGVDAVILSRLLESPFDDFGNDVSNFTKVDHVYGSNQELKDLIDELHETDIKVFLEINPNHSHKKHPYFEKSRNSENKYKDYYIWSDGRVTEDGTNHPPNNWVSRYGGSAWTWDDVRQQYYYHYYSEHTADFNFRNQNVLKELQKVISYWLQQGFDGIILEGAHVFYEIDDFTLDEPQSDKTNAQPGDYDYLQHVYTEDHSDIHDFMTTAREWIDHASAVHNKKIAMIMNINENQIGDRMKYYQTGAHAPISHHLMKITDTTGGRDIWDIVDFYKLHLPEGQDPVWMLSHLDTGLLALNTGLLYQNVLNMLMLLLPGAAITFMGEDLGIGTLDTKQLDHIYKNKRHQQVASMMAPMPWNKELYGGFSKTTSWLPLRENNKDWNVETEKEEPSNTSPIHLYGKLARLRKETSFINGDLQYALVNDNIFSFMRFAKNSAPYLIAINIGTVQSTDDYTLTAGVQYGKVVAYAKPVGAKRSTYVQGRTVDIQKLTLNPGEGVVFLLLIDIVMDASVF